MGKRKRVGLVLLENKEWIAGTYYMLNIIKALNTLDKNLMPCLVLITENKERFQNFKEATEYPFLEFYQYPEKINDTIPKNLIGRLSKKLSTFKRELKIDFIYPRPLKNLCVGCPEVHWIPDFQEDYLPHFFSAEEVAQRKDLQSQASKNADLIVFSSKDANNDFHRLYPEATAKTFILPFAVSHPNISALEIVQLRIKYGLPERYFILPNQFWAHKNHSTVLKAAKLLKVKNEDFMIAMTGSETDYRNRGVYKDLQHYITANNLKDNIKSLGFIPRQDQVCLLKNAIAVIQPSLFEGWSTVVEDAKALKKFLILSDIKVHREQITKNVEFFEPNDEVELSRLLIKYNEKEPRLENMDYGKEVEKFGKRFLELIQVLETR